VVGVGGEGGLEAATGGLQGVDAVVGADGDPLGVAARARGRDADRGGDHIGLARRGFLWRRVAQVGGRVGRARRRGARDVHRVGLVELLVELLELLDLGWLDGLVIVGVADERGRAAGDVLDGHDLVEVGVVDLGDGVGGGVLGVGRGLATDGVGGGVLGVFAVLAELAGDREVGGRLDGRLGLGALLGGRVSRLASRVRPISVRMRARSSASSSSASCASINASAPSMSPASMRRRTRPSIAADRRLVLLRVARDAGREHAGVQLGGELAVAE
jgi:hypothetical protein